MEDENRKRKSQDDFNHSKELYIGKAMKQTNNSLIVMNGKGSTVESGAIRSDMPIIGGTNITVSNHPVGKCEDQNARKKEKNNLKDLFLILIEKLLDSRDERQKLFLSENGIEDKLETMVTGAKKEDLLTFKKLINSIGLIRGPNECGSIFIADVSGVGVVLLSAGHIFEAILNKNSCQKTLLQLSNYSTIFGNIEGKIPKNGDENTLERGKPMNMQLFFKKFCVYGSICWQGKCKAFKRVKNDGKSEMQLITEFKEGLNRCNDYCAILLDPDIKNHLDELGLDTLECATGQQLTHQKNQCVSIIGHPGHSDWDEYPLRLSYGLEINETPNLTKIASSYDSLDGNSGSPVFNQHYKVKGIHVAGGKDGNKENYMQKLDILNWINVGRDISE